MASRDRERKAVPNLIGESFGKWTIISGPIDTGYGRGPESRSWICLCSCSVERAVNESALKHKRSTSCGCKSTIHGMSTAAEYHVWVSMKDRCLNDRNPSFKHYGGRGISICAEWLESFERFIADMGARPSNGHQIERTNNDGPYSPGNCRWATRMEQARNRRTTVLITKKGKTMCATDWAQELGLSRQLVCLRIRRGESAEDALRPSRAKRIANAAA